MDLGDEDSRDWAFAILVEGGRGKGFCCFFCDWAGQLREVLRGVMIAAMARHEGKETDTLIEGCTLAEIKSFSSTFHDEC